MKKLKEAAMLVLMMCCLAFCATVGAGMLAPTYIILLPQAEIWELKTLIVLFGIGTWTAVGLGLCLSARYLFPDWNARWLRRGAGETALDDINQLARGLSYADKWRVFQYHQARAVQGSMYIATSLAACLCWLQLGLLLFWTTRGNVDMTASAIVWVALTAVACIATYAAFYYKRLETLREQPLPAALT